MDPITAIFAFLATPAGQTVAGQLMTVESKFVGMIGDLVKVVHSKNPAPAADPTTKTAPASPQA